MLSRIAAFVIWAAVAASAAYWGLQLLSSPLQVPAHATQVSISSSHRGDLARVLGADLPVQVGAAPVSAPLVNDSRFRLIGVVAPRNPAVKTEGLAVISMDSKPPRAYAVGSTVDGDLVLLSVNARGASLGPTGQAAQISLELPALPPPATGMPGSAGMTLPAARATPLPSRPIPPRPPSQDERSATDSRPGGAEAPTGAPSEIPPDSSGESTPAPPSGMVRERSPV